MDNKVNLDILEAEFLDASGDVASWCENQYDKIFSQYFDNVSDLYLRLTKTKTKITDEELEWVLTFLPLQLIAVSEDLSLYKLNNNNLKIYIKKLELESAHNSTAKTVTESKDIAYLDSASYRMLSNAYASVITRVENQINFSRELIMSAKKIWDSRKSTMEASPINSVNVELEDYVMND